MENEVQMWQSRKQCMETRNQNWVLVYCYTGINAKAMKKSNSYSFTTVKIVCLRIFTNLEKAEKDDIVSVQVLKVINNLITSSNIKLSNII